MSNVLGDRFAFDATLDMSTIRTDKRNTLLKTDISGDI